MAEDKAWRAFEQRVADIEKALSPRGARVTSPDWIRDLVTGQPREVDASIRMRVGSSDVLITVECRRRAHKEDVTWVEQLATKKNNIGASKTIAVSSTGFSSAAMDLARRSGIDLRRLEDRIEDELVASFTQGLKIELTEVNFAIRGVTIELEDGRTPSVEDFAPELRNQVAQDSLRAPLVVEVSSGRVLRLGNWAMSAGDQDLLIGGPPVEKQLRLEFKPRTATIALREGPQFVRSLTAGIGYTKSVHRAPVTSYLEYGPLDATLRQTVEAEAKIDETRGYRIGVDLFMPSIASKPLVEPHKDSEGAA
jgi:Restriction endonuclease